MHKIKKLAIIGVILLIAGAVGAILTGSKEKETVSETKKLPGDAFQSIDIETDNARVEVVTTAESTAKAEVSGAKAKGKKYRFSASIENKTLTVRLKERYWKLFQFDLFSKPLVVKIYVPQKHYASLKIKSDNGRVSLAQVHADVIYAASDNGRLTLNDLQGKKLTANTSNGRVYTKNIHFADVTLDSDNGKIELVQAKTHKTHLHTNNGSVNLESVTGEIIGRTENGKITMQTDNLDRPIDFQTNNGGITIKTANRPKNAAFIVNVHNGRAEIFGQEGSRVFGDGKNKIELSTDNGKIKVTD